MKTILRRRWRLALWASLLGLGLWLAGCESDTAPEDATAVSGPALIFYYTDN